MEEQQRKIKAQGERYDFSINYSPSNAFKTKSKRSCENTLASSLKRSKLMFLRKNKPASSSGPLLTSSACMSNFAAEPGCEVSIAWSRRKVRDIPKWLPKRINKAC